MDEALGYCKYDSCEKSNANSRNVISNHWTRSKKWNKSYSNWNLVMNQLNIIFSNILDEKKNLKLG